MGLLDGLFGSGGADDRDRALNLVQNVPLPVLKEYYPELYDQVVSLNPEMETTVNLGPSEMQGIATDPALRQAQMDALSKLQDIGNADGKDAQFMAKMNQAQNDVNTNLAGQMGAIEQEMAMKGMSGGMSEMVAKNMAAQQGANRQSQMGFDAAAEAERRALDAIMKSGDLGGSLRTQDFNEQAAKAQAQDAINKFNTQNRQNVISANTAAKNNAQQWNATNAQNVAAQNTQTRNEAQKYNLGLNQQRFDNEMSRATGVANQYNARGDSKDKERDSERQFVGGLIGAGSQFFGGK